MSAKDTKYNRSAKGRARYARYRATEKGQDNEIRQHEKHNPRRIFIGGIYVGTESKFPYQRAEVERHLFGLYEEFRQRQADEYDAFHAKLEDEVPPARISKLTSGQLAMALLPLPAERKTLA
jgi:hypothetical protein